MKLHALMIAAALAFAGTAFAQNSYGTAKAPADVNASASAGASGSMSTHHAKPHHKVAKAKRMHARHHASAMAHHEQMHARAHMERHHMHARAKMERHEMHARAHMEHHNTHAMGAGPSAPVTDLDARARDARMNSAYEDWQRLQSRR